jgi:signal transduction histidine kinase
MMHLKKKLLCEFNPRIGRYVFHEVRVPLNTIRLGLDSVPPNESNSDTAYVFGCLDKAANSISEILNDVLSYQKVIEGKLELNRVPFALEGFLRSCQSDFASAAAAKALTLTYEKHHGMRQELVGDIILLRQVLSNFLSNASRFLAKVVVTRTNTNSRFVAHFFSFVTFGIVSFVRFVWLIFSNYFLYRQ